MKLPRFSSGRIGRLDYKDLNQAFTAIEDLQGEAGVAHAYSGTQRESFVATITGLMTDAVQGVLQDATGQGTLIKTYIYDWNEVDISSGNAGTGSGVGVSDLQGARGIDYVAALGSTGYYPAIDFAPYRRYAAGDVVLLTRIAIKSGSSYSAMYAISPLNAVTPFLARLTESLGSGRYAWTGLSRIIEGTVALKTEATNLYEKNRVSTPGATTPLEVDGVSWDGSGNWGHGQVLSGASTTIAQLNLPAGPAGTGTIVIMHQSHVLENGTAFYFYSVAPITASCV